MQKLDCDELWFRKRALKIKTENKNKKTLIVFKSGLVGMKGYLKTYNNPVKYFLPIYAVSE